jgi:beta-glucosidase
MTDPSIDRPLRQLQGWQRVTLDPSQSSSVEIDFPLAGLAVWDVDRHDYTIEPGTYEVLVGRSSAEIRSTADLVVTGDRPRPRIVVDVDVAAADFDDYAGITLVDTTRETGDAVETVDPDDAWVLFRAADLSAVPTSIIARVSQPHPGTSRLEVRIDQPDGPLLATVAVPCTGDRYAWVDVTAEIAAVDGVHDVYLLLRGHFRLDTVRLRH